jgi:hypothetical protein
MKRMRSVALVVLGIAVVPALSGATGGHRRTGTPITVKPSNGSPGTRFVVSFRAPDRTGRYGTSERRYELSATGAQGAKGCRSSITMQLPASRAHARVSVTLDPTRHAGRWCAGPFAGQIDEIQQPVCSAGQACPAYVVRLGTVGNFKFHVKSTGGNTTPPTFAGIQSAFACTPGPQRPGQTTPFNLSWKAASDDATPSSKIVYAIYMSTTSGEENFSSPNWTTPPGATTFRTPGLASHGTFYFVVRARDQAGHEDQNKVERRGEDPCL